MARIENTYDVALVGASIAGCTAATLLAREGASVALIERHSDPNSYKVLCTHFIQPSAVPTMERLGLKPLVGAEPEIKPNNRLFYFAHYRNLRLASSKKSQLWLLEPDVAYTFPNDDDITILTCMPAREKLPAFKEDLEGSFVGFFDDLPEGPDLAGAERVLKIMGATNLQNRSRPVSVDGLALVGDAALWSDPLWGIGCGWAFQSAE